MAETVKHTPGPWKAVKATHGPIDILDSRGRDVVTIYGGGVETESQGANARLIAAAPEILDTLKAVYADHTYETPSGYINCRFCDCNTDHEGTFRDTHDEDCLIRPVRAAIAKAEGRS